MGTETPPVCAVLWYFQDTNANHKQGNTLVLQVALGQDNIDDVLKLSRDYKKSEFQSPLLFYCLLPNALLFGLLL